MELMYRLDLPSATEILLESVHEEIAKKIPWQRGSTDQYLKPEWAEINGIRWTHWVQYYRDVVLDNQVSFIHTDKFDGHHPDEHPWGISWISGGDGQMDYWNPEDLVETRFKFNVRNGALIVGYENPHDVPPRKSYHMKPGVYLVNADYPHRAHGWNDRYNFCLRSYHDQNIMMLWSDVIERFKDKIIPWD
jgi:hypothetical protein